MPVVRTYLGTGFVIPTWRNVKEEDILLDGQKNEIMEESAALCAISTFGFAQEVKEGVEAM
jgi:hypothetical protein